MSWVTIGGTPAANVEAGGIKNFGGALSAADLLAAVHDAQRAVQSMFVPGIVAGGVCTASGLNVTVPANTIYYARSQWVTAVAAVYAVPDNATTYLWGCSDGVVRQTATNTYPTSFDATNCCLLGKFVASSGTVTVDITLQPRARYVGLVPFVYENWHQDNMAASQTALVMAHYSGAFNQYSIPMRAGFVTGLQISNNGTWAGGSCTAILYINGSPTTLTAVIDTTNRVRTVTWAPPQKYPFAAQDLIDVRLTTDGSWAPTTQDVLCSLETLQIFA